MSEAKPIGIAREKLGQYPTPVIDLSKILESAGAFEGKRLWLKRDDYSGIELSGNKTRKLEFALAEAKALGAKVVITAGAMQSNHCRATVVACRQLGLTPHLLLFGEAGRAQGGNFAMDALLGAEITYVEPSAYATYLDIMNTIAKTYEDKDLKAYCIPIGASYGIGNFGYIEGYREIMQWQKALNEDLDAIVCTVGSGGTYAGLWLGQYLLKGEEAFRQTQIIGISISADRHYFEARVLEILEETCQYTEALNEIYNVCKKGAFNAEHMLATARRTIRIIDGYQGEGYAIPYEPAEQRRRWLASCTGIVLDHVYTGKAFHGMLDSLEKQALGQQELSPIINTLFIHTGGIFGTL